MNINKRILKDIKDGKKNLKEEFGIHISPEENNYFRIHFILPGPEDTPFEGGLYHGMIRLNDNHPYAAPNIHMITPSGRFIPEAYPIPATSRGICTTSTAWHPESWTPMNNIESVLKGFISLMCEPYDGGIGGMKSTDEQMRKLAKQSINQLKLDISVKEYFPELYQSLVSGTYVPVRLSDLSKQNSTNNGKKNKKQQIIIVDDIPKKKTNLPSEEKSDSDTENFGKKSLKNKKVQKLVHPRPLNGKKNKKEK